jgi:coenzyme F420-dependent glucose-6-phosphate dehydrogenase
MIAASQPGAAELAGRAGDAMINTEVEEDLIARFDGAGGAGKPRYMELSVCWAKDESQARKTAHEVWSLAALEGPLFTELSLPSHFEAAMKPISEEKVAEAVVCGPDPRKHVEAIEKAARSGYTHVCVHQIGPEQEAFLKFYRSAVLPALGEKRGSRPKPPAKEARTARRPPVRVRGDRREQRSTERDTVSRRRTKSKRGRAK